MATAESDSSLVGMLDASVPHSLKEFDAFPKLPASYKARSGSRGLATLFVAALAFVLLLPDLGEYIWGWPDYEFSVDTDTKSALNINVDLLVNMPCASLSVDLRDAVGDRLYLSSGFTRDGTLFDIGQATKLKEHAAALSARQAVSQSRRGRSFFSTLFQKAPAYKPTYNRTPDGRACRIYGTLEVKKVTANFHITTVGHGYASMQHTDHNLMNLSHVINEFSFGPYFPDITQPLDNSLEITQDHFMAYQYFLHIVPTTYIAPRSAPLRTHQYSVTHYTRTFEHGRGTPGIFFKFDLDPMSLTIHQRTTSFLALVIRSIGVIGGIFTCMGWAIKIGSHAVDTITGTDRAPGLVAAEASGAQRRNKWRGSALRPRTGGSNANSPVNGVYSPSSVQSGWGNGNGSDAGSPYASSYAASPGSPYPSSPFPASPAAYGGSALPSPSFGPPPVKPAFSPALASPGGAQFGLGLPPSSPALPNGAQAHVRVYSNSSAHGSGNGNGSPYSGSPYLPPPQTGSQPGTPSTTYSPFPPSPAPNPNGFAARPGPPRSASSGSPVVHPKKDD